jgi:hypothetical protein
MPATGLCSILAKRRFGLMAVKTDRGFAPSMDSNPTLQQRRVPMRTSLRHTTALALLAAADAKKLVGWILALELPKK